MTASTMTLLGYLIPRVDSRFQEPAATQVLVYLLNETRDLAQAFINEVPRIDKAAFTPGRIVAEKRHGKAQPDVTILDDNGGLRILVENKLGAGLREGQPVAYLEELPDHASSGLIFIVPRELTRELWRELRKRCRRDKDIELTAESEEDAMIWAHSGQRTLAITSWTHILDILEQAAVDGEHSALQQVIVQLRELTGPHVSEVPPLGKDEVGDRNAPLRLVNYVKLIEGIVSGLATGETGVADTTDLRWMYKEFWAGRNLLLRSKVKVLLGDSGRWRGQDCSGIEDKFREAERLFDKDVARRLVNYIELIQEIVSRLEGDDVADAYRLHWKCEDTWAGQNLYLRRFGRAWLGVDLVAWRDGVMVEERRAGSRVRALTPIWLEHEISDSCSGIEDKVCRAKKLFEGTHKADGWLKIPIRLETGVERECVIRGAVEQMCSIAMFLQESSDR